MKAGKAWGAHDFIFCDQAGEPYSQERLRYFFKQILKAAELPENFNPYSARHSSATHLIGAGVDVKTVSKRLGHADVRITLGTYTHPTDEMEERAADEKWSVSSRVVGKPKNSIFEEVDTLLTHKAGIFR